MERVCLKRGSVVMGGEMAGRGQFVDGWVVIGPVCVAFVGSGVVLYNTMTSDDDDVA